MAGYHTLADLKFEKVLNLTRSNIYIYIYIYIIESVDSISRNGPDTPIYAIHYKKPKNSDQFDFSVF